MRFALAEIAARAALLAMAWSSTACEMVAKAGTNGRAAGEAAGPSKTGRAPETRKKAPITPALVAASERLLAEHHDAPIGSEFPIVVEGKAYVARIEEHENASGSPSRPPGKHKGVTVYVR